MSREWVDELNTKPSDRLVVMRCDHGALLPGPRCTTQSEPQPNLQSLSLTRFLAEGWSVAKHYGDLCPSCVAAGHVMHGERWLPTSTSDGGTA